MLLLSSILIGRSFGYEPSMHHLEEDWVELEQENDA